MSHGPSKILVDVTPILPHGKNGGAKIFVLELLNRLSLQYPKTHFTLLTQSISRQEFKGLERSNVTCLPVLNSSTKESVKPFFLKSVSRLYGFLPDHLGSMAHKIGYRFYESYKRVSLRPTEIFKADLLFCPMTAPVFRKKGLPTVCTIYDLQHKTYPLNFSRAEIVMRDQIFSNACRYGNGLAAISNYSRNSAIEHGAIGQKRIRTIYPRLARRISARRDDQKILCEWNLTPGEYLLYPGNFWKHKNHEMLLTAFSIALRNGLHDKIKLVLTGEACDRQVYLANAVRAMNLSGRVHFVGYLSDAAFSTIMKNCRAVVFPSLYEGFGLPVIEAMAAGVPVACSNRTCLPEIVCQAALLFDPRMPAEMAEAIGTIVKDDGLRSKLTAAGKIRSDEFHDSGRMASEYWDLFCHVVQTAKKRVP